MHESTQEDIDLRLMELTSELAVLEQYLEFVEEQSQKWTTNALKAQLQELAIDLQCAEDWYVEWDLKNQEWELQTEFILPKILHSPFLVTLFALYETTVTEVANLLQRKQNTKISIADLKGSLLTRVKKYFGEVIQFEYSSSNQNWERITHLSRLRNAIVHANARFDMMHKERQKRTRKLLNVKGVYECYGYILVTKAFLKETFFLVKEELESLASRYKKHDLGC